MLFEQCCQKIKVLQLIFYNIMENSVEIKLTDFYQIVPLGIGFIVVENFKWKLLFSLDQLKS